MSRTYTLVIKDTNKPTKLVSLNIVVVISGYLSRCVLPVPIRLHSPARTTVTMVFLNDTDNDTEGELNFPMPESM
jgi:hypothetical protein